jgi:hypothetical protein
MVTRKELFRRWLKNPTRHKLSYEGGAVELAAGSGTILGVEDALWLAFQEGYRACLADVGKNLRHLGAVLETVDR